MGSSVKKLKSNLGLTPAYSPTLSSGPNAGQGYGTGDDFLSPRNIGDLTTGFSQGINPIETNNPYLLNQQMLFSHNASPSSILLATSQFISSVRPPAPSTSYSYGGSDPFNHNPPPGEILLVTNGIVGGISPTTSSNPYNLVQLPNLNTPSILPIPDIGHNPFPVTILSDTTQVQNSLMGIGAPAIPGYPIIHFDNNPSALDFMGQTDALIDAITPYQPGRTGLGALYPTGVPGAYINYPPPPIMPSYPQNPFSQGYYSQFSPYSGPSSVVPSQIPYPAPVPQYPAPQPQPQQFPIESIIDAIRSAPLQLPDYIPFSGSAAKVIPLLNDYPKFSESQRVDIRQNLANPTTVDNTILTWSGVNTNGGGKYDMGTVHNPFTKANFLQDTNPYNTYHTGMVVTNGNGNGKVKGTPVSDLIIGAQPRNNIIDGRGGEDDIVGSTRQDLVNLHQGDHVFTDKGNDLMMLDFTELINKNCRTTTIDGGEGKDILVLTVDGNPTDDNNQPQFRRLADGTTRIVYNNVEVRTKGLERIIIADKKGNIGGQYDVQ